ncbi:hypothetical protein [Pleionea sp. CnH1-48]|uniref:DUF6985 domain-containing protein n=1 Tax=Pleionea sp. CnH1-48 TaxID=2954494 RepID=UPI002097CF52|nr:hypothetical protein [Pleionea sp. CnH1-48]MCO7227581.1 hypothetical protein [Pleionea sp. CnH1-48]
MTRINQIARSDFKFDLEEYLWVKKYSIELFGECVSTNIFILGEEDVEIENEQIVAVNDFVEYFQEYLAQLEENLLLYFKDNLDDICSRYESESQKKVALNVNSERELSKVMSIEGILIPYSFDKSQLVVGFMFQRSWDLSHNLGVKFVNRKLVMIDDAAGLLF